MAIMAVRVLLLALCAAGAVGSEVGANPIRKIVTLLQDMSKEIEAEGAKESALFEKFMCFCNGNTADMEKSAADGKAKVEELASKVESEKAEKSGLEQDLIGHKADLAQAEDDLAKSTALRSKEQAEFEGDSADQKSNLDAISGALPALEKGLSGAALMQMPQSTRLRSVVESSKYSNSYDRNLVISFLEQSGDYVPQSGQIVGIMKNMKDEMEASLKELVASEQSAVTGYEELKAAKSQEIAAAKTAIQTKTKRTGELALSIVQAEDALDDTSKELADTQKFLATLDVQCVEKKKSWAARSQARAQEVQAISETISILNDDDALDVFKKAVPSSLVQAPEFGFLQSHKQSSQDKLVRRLHKAPALIASAAQIYQSRPLQLLAFSVKTQLRRLQKGGANQKADFGDITKMIDGMVDVLKKEQEDDESHKTFCVAEFGKNADEQQDTKAEIAATDATLAELNDEVSMLVEDMKTLTAGIAGLDKSVAQATEQRKEEHQDYTETLALSETAVALLEKAKQRLLKFYNPVLYKTAPKVERSMETKIIDAGSMSFAQVNSHRAQQPEAPETWSAPVEKKSEKSGGVMALMDMMMKEMKDSMKDAEHDEQTAQKEYTALMAASQETRAQDAKSLTDKASAKAQTESKVVTAKESKSLSVQSLETLNNYNGDLHASCDFIMSSFDLRKEARTNELESLKNAKAVLAGANFGF